MKTSFAPLFGRFALLALALAAAFAHAADTTAAPLPVKKILFFTRSVVYEHSVIKRTGSNPSFAMQVLNELGAKNGYAFTESKDGSLFTPEYLAQFDAYFFYTTGDLTEATAVDHTPAITAAGKAALIQAVANGKGFIGTHAASDTFHSPGNRDIVAARFTGDGDKADDYVKMLGAEFIRHGAQQAGHLMVADPKFPGISGVPADFQIPMEEWYGLKNFAPDIHVILVQDTAGMKGDDYARPPYPETWARMQGKGRVFYTSLGHREDVWMNPAFQAVLLGGLNWATGRVDADLTPNLDQVAPKANVLPKLPANVPVK